MAEFGGVLARLGRSGTRMPSVTFPVRLAEGDPSFCAGQRQPRSQKRVLRQRPRQCARLARQIDKAAGRDWTLAARRLHGELVYSIGTCRRQLEQIALDTGTGPGRELGTYEVIALDANPAASDSDVIHPHVQAGQLCEGEGRTAVRRALREGRVLDFVVLVRQILQTYNPGSAYVSLERWKGVRCPDCGELVGEDDCVPCGHCEAYVCGECVFTCAGCDQPFCSSCIECCSGCEERYCSACLDACAGCGKPFCQECLTDEKCSSCLDAGREESPERESQPACVSAHCPPVLKHGPNTALRRTGRWRMGKKGERVLFVRLGVNASNGVILDQMHIMNRARPGTRSTTSPRLQTRPDRPPAHQSRPGSA